MSRCWLGQKRSRGAGLTCTEGGQGEDSIPQRVQTYLAEILQHCSHDMHQVWQEERRNLSGNWTEYNNNATMQNVTNYFFNSLRAIFPQSSVSVDFSRAGGFWRTADLQQQTSGSHSFHCVEWLQRSQVSPCLHEPTFLSSLDQQNHAGVGGCYMSHYSEAKELSLSSLDY